MDNPRLIVREGDTMRIDCNPKAFPEAAIEWRRADGTPIIQASIIVIPSFIIHPRTTPSQTSVTPRHPAPSRFINLSHHHQARGNSLYSYFLKDSAVYLHPPSHFLHCIDDLPGIDKLIPC